MDLSTTYLGFKLDHPLMAGASPLSMDLDTIKKLEDSGSSAIVMHSLFEEQIVAEQVATYQSVDGHGDSHAEMSSLLPSPPDFKLGPEEYLTHLENAKQAISVPLIGSLNGTRLGNWLEYAKLIEQAGADALELNIYDLATDATVNGADIEANTVEVVGEVVKSIQIPVTVKLSPFYSSLPNFVAQLEQAGAKGVVLFNRFYQPNIDVDELEVFPFVNLSTPDELLLRLRWLAILSGRIDLSLAASGGVHSSLDAIKAVMCGAHAVQMVSVLLANGPDFIKTIKDKMEFWLVEHEYESLEQMQGSMNLSHSPDPKAFERTNYMHVLKSWSV